MMPPFFDMMFPRACYRASSSQASRLRGVGALDAELLRVLGVQSLKAAELHRLRPDRASNGLTDEKVIQYVEADVPPGGAHCNVASINAGPQRQASAATKGFEFPPHIEVTPLVLK